MNFDDVVIGEKYIATADENGNFLTYGDYPEAFILYAKSCDDEKVVKEMTRAIARHCTGVSLNIGDILTCIGKFVDRDGCNIGLFDKEENEGLIRSYVLDTSFVTSLEKDCKKSKYDNLLYLSSCSEDEIFDIVNFIVDRELISLERLSDIIKRKGGCITVMNEIKDNMSLSDILKNYSVAEITNAIHVLFFPWKDYKVIIKNLIDLG